uniref:Topo IIA-type catalytic domain-containing protein n=1 Tax=Biomphalaria glabrata TaxID=6526 RepID=A0A2C9JR33_BIOGL
MSAQLISVHGNNGSIDGDSPAAMRYTEAKLSEISEYIVGHLDKKITTFQNNFDDAEEEPTVFPTFIPNLLVNGATGIAAGYATDIPPHNLTEVINAIIYCLHHQNFSIDNVLDIIQGPDFPTGGEIIATKEQLKEIYSTGKGKIFNQAKTTIIATKKGYQIVIDELPFNVIKKTTDFIANDIVDSILTKGLPTGVDNSYQLYNFLETVTSDEINEFLDNQVVHKNSEIDRIVNLLDGVYYGYTGYSGANNDVIGKFLLFNHQKYAKITSDTMLESLDEALVNVQGYKTAEVKDLLSLVAKDSEEFLKFKNIQFELLVNRFEEILS